MSLLDTASLIVTPNAYKAGKLYSVVPSNGNGDFTATRATTATRVNSEGLVESVASNIPRLDYSLGSCPNLLLEPQRTNICTYSEDMSQNKQVSNISVTLNTDIAPNGVQTADKLTTTSTSNPRIGSVNVLSAGVFSVFAKAVDAQFIQLINTGDGEAYGNFDLINGVIGTFGTKTTATIESYGNGWYRCMVYFNIAYASLSRLYITTSASASYGGAGGPLNASILTWGWQLEVGAYPTSYIPTTTASVTRNADQISLSNVYTNGLITASGGTWFVELKGNVAYKGDASGDGIFLQTVGNTDNFRLQSGTVSSARIIIFKTVSNVKTQLYTTTTNTTKIAIKWNGTTADIFANGVKVVSATAFTNTIMQNLATSITGAPKNINEMALFPTPLTDTQCIAITS
jgi:hypothetical protein